MASQSTSAAHGGANAAAAAAKAAANARALQQLHNQRVPAYFAITIIGLILVVTIFHWSRIIYHRYVSRKSAVVKVGAGIFRVIRHVRSRPAPVLTSVENIVLVLIYLAINVSLTVTNVDWSSLIGIAKRCGWMAITNVAFITFLALKNTPLAFLTAYSYERLNILHQIGGYTTVTYSFLHVTLMCESLEKLHFPQILIEKPQIHGIIAASAMFVILATAVTIRKMRYEVFYVTHIAMYILILINIGLHRPEIATKTVIITIFAASLWGSDRLLRFCRILWYSHNNRATITPLSNGGTRIILRRSPSRAVPGTHCFVWIPKIRLAETHPFTIVSSTPQSLELVVAARDGFTKSLHEYAKLKPGASLRASIDGPYGAIPNFSKDADKVVLIAGGSGASFTFGVALDMIKKLGNSTKTTIDFIWVVRHQEYLSWYSSEISELQASPLVNVSLYTTRDPTLSSTLASSPSDSGVPSPSSPSSPVILPSDPEKDFPTSSSSPLAHTSIGQPSQVDVEKNSSSQPQSSWSPSSSLNIVSAKPNIEEIIRTVVRSANATDRIVVAACGPDGLRRRVRKTTADCMTMKGPSVELHCEQFGW